MKQPFHESRLYFGLLCAGWGMCAALFIVYVVPVIGAEMAIYADIFRGM